MALNRELRLAQSFNDSIEYKKLKRKNKDLSLLNEIKSERLKQNEKHLDILKIKENYENSDSKDFPAWIFCEDSVIEFYKLSNDFLKNEILPLDKIHNRKSFLDNSTDKGNYYHFIKQRLLSKSELNIIIQEKENLLESLNNLFKDLFTEDNYKTFLYCKSVLNENKKNKKKLFIVKNNLQILEEQTGINISKFFSVYWNLPELYIPIKKSKIRKNKGIDFEFEHRIDKITLFNDKIFNEDKFIYQTLNKIVYSGISILTGESNNDNYQYKQNSDDNFKKKWSELSKEQRLIKFKDYSNYFILNKIFLKHISSELDSIKQNFNIDTSFIFESENILIDKLYNLISINYLEGILKYKHIRWNIKFGIIDSISNIHWNVSHSDDDKIILEPSLKISPSIQKTKSVNSSKSLFTLKSNIELANEFLLKFILDHFYNYIGNDFSSIKTKLFDLSIDKIKHILKINKLTTSDKEFILTQFNLFFDEIIDSQLKTN